MKTRILSHRIRSAARLLHLVAYELDCRMAENQIPGHNESDVTIMSDEEQDYFEVEIKIRTEKRTGVLFSAFGVFRDEASAEIFINQAMVEAIMKLNGPIDPVERPQLNDR